MPTDDVAQRLAQALGPLGRDLGTERPGTERPGTERLRAGLHPVGAVDRVELTFDLVRAVRRSRPRWRIVRPPA